MSELQLSLINGTASTTIKDIKYYNNFIYYVQQTAPQVRKINTTTYVISDICSDNALSTVTCLELNSQYIILGIGGFIYGINIYLIDITEVDTSLQGPFFSGQGDLTSVTLTSDLTTLYTMSNYYNYIAYGNLNQMLLPDFSSTEYVIPSTITNMQYIKIINDNIFICTNTNIYIMLLSVPNVIQLTIPADYALGFDVDSFGDYYATNINSICNITGSSLNPISSTMTKPSYIAFDAYDIIYVTSSDVSQNGVFKSNDAFCFNQGTKILCLNTHLVDEYIPIELLKIGDFVKTYKHGYRKISKTIQGSFRNNPKKFNMCMYKMAKTEKNGLLEDLIVTGGHSLLVDSISETEKAKYDAMGLSIFTKLSIDGKHLLLSSVSDQFTPLQDRSNYTYYHLLLENNDDEEECFGIYANGILTETPNTKTVNYKYSL
jgi:hypothetical protein